MRTPLLSSSWVAVSLLLAAPVLGVAGEVRLPNGAMVKQVDFERHVMAVFGRMGCAAGSCHGSFQGKGGFRLSLFGYDPDKDYEAVIRSGAGRRIDPVNPDASLLLLKATGQVEHGGFRRFSRDSWAYQLIREWIRQGARRTSGSGAVLRVAVQPGEYDVEEQQAGEEDVERLRRAVLVGLLHCGGLPSRVGGGEARLSSGAAREAVQS